MGHYSKRICQCMPQSTSIQWGHRRHAHAFCLLSLCCSFIIQCVSTSETGPGQWPRRDQVSGFHLAAHVLFDLVKQESATSVLPDASAHLPWMLNSDNSTSSVYKEGCNETQDGQEVDELPSFLFFVSGDKNGWGSKKMKRMTKVLRHPTEVMHIATL